MRKLYLIASILLLSSVWLVAQSTPAQQPSTDQSSPSSASPSQSSPAQSTAPDASQTSNSSTSIEGCLAGSSGSYTLTDSTGKSWQLAGDTSKLTEHVGHQVRLSGSEAGGAGASGAAGSSASAGASGSSAQSTFTVQKVKMISSSCPTGK